MTTLGKYRHLTQASTPAGHFVVLAIDHRANLVAALSKHQGQVTDHDFSQFKLQIIKNLLPLSSAVLTDPTYGIAAGITTGVISGQVGLLAPLEVTNYDIHPSQRITQFITGWSVEKIKRVGATGVKLLLYFHPDDVIATEKRDLVSGIVEQCRKSDIPLYLEPIAYSLDTQQPLKNAEFRQVVVESARIFSALGVDILKMEFPVNPAQETDENIWLEACKELNDASEVPWTILSAGTDFETFRRQATIACQAGASGVIVGRAVWNEAVALHGDSRETFISVEGRARLHELGSICATYATDWRSRVSLPSTALNWFESYGQ